MSAWLTIAEPDQHNIRAIRHSRQSMLAGIAYLRSNVPPGSVLLVEKEAAEVLQYYLDRQLNAAAPFRIEISKDYQWQDFERFKSDMAAARSNFAMRIEEPLWIVEGGWQMNVVPLLRQQNPGLVLPAFRNVDDALTLFQVPPEI